MNQPPRIRRSIHIGLLGLLLGLSAAAGCAGEDALPASVAPEGGDLALRDVASGNRQPLVRVYKGHDHLVSFYRMGSGEIMISQLGRGASSPIALPSDPVAAFREVAPDEPVPEVLERASSDRSILLGGADTQAAPVIVFGAPEAFPKGAFPWQSFKCWALSQLNCLYDQSGPLKVRFPPASRFVHRYNAVWAVDAGSIHTEALLMFDNGRRSEHYKWDLHEGQWQAIQSPGPDLSQVIVGLPFGPASYHFSDAHGQQ
jgi:hypothetical protein